MSLSTSVSAHAEVLKRSLRAEPEPHATLRLSTIPPLEQGLLGYDTVVNARVVVRISVVVILTLRISLAVPLALSWLYGDGSWTSSLFPDEAMILSASQE